MHAPGRDVPGIRKGPHVACGTSPHARVDAHLGAKPGLKKKQQTKAKPGLKKKAAKPGLKKKKQTPPGKTGTDVRTRIESGVDGAQS